MRALFVTHSFPRARGDVAGAFILRLAVALRALDVEVDVLAPAAPGIDRDAILDGIPVHRFRYAPASWETLAYTGTMAEQARGSIRGAVSLAGMVVAGRQAVARAMARRSYDVVHAHWWFPSGLSAALTRAGRPLVVTMHGSDVRLAGSSVLGPRLFRFVARRAAAMTTVSGWLADRVRDLYPGTPIAIAPMPVDTTLFKPSNGEREAAALFVGRLNAQKGVRDLIRVMAHAGDLRLDVVGDGPDRASLESLASEVGVADRIRWHGALSQELVARLYARAALLVVPSRDEGLGLVVVEALLSGTPVVAYRSGGVTELIQHDATGLLVEPGDTAALGAAIASLGTDTDRARRMGERGRSAMSDRFAPAAVAAAYAALYRRVCHR